MKKYLKIFIPTVSLILFFLVIWKIVLPRINPAYKIDKFNINELNVEEKPFVWDKIAPLEPDFPVDQDGIIFYANQYYHPNQLANTGLYYFDSYRKTNNNEYLVRAEKHAKKLIEKSQEIDGALYFPYEFDFKLHDLKDDVLRAPWYSGMAQGEALSLFVRLYQETNQKEYLAAAQKTFKSFSRLGEKNNPWTVYVDSAGYYWIEEYPEESPDHTLNGFIFGLYGVYDYYELTKDRQAKEISEAALTTLKHYLTEFRKEGGVSYYCLKHQKQDKKYHQTHIEQLNMLYKTTGDEYFKSMADNFYNDYH